MKNIRKPNAGIIQKIVFILVLIIITWVSANINWGDHRYTRIIKVDGNGYYAYLPAVFIYNDLNFNFFEDIRNKYHPSNFEYEYRYTYQEKTVNKYYCGTAILLSPFFLFGHFLTNNAGLPQDGYSYYYLVLLSLAAIFYLFVALHFINALLRSYKIRTTNRTLTLLLIVFGTNAFYYTVHEPSMSHIYSLAIISLFAFNTRLYFMSFDRLRLIVSSVLLGLIFLIRPVNILVILAVPFLADDKNNFLRGIKFLLKSYGSLSLALVSFLAIISIQFIIYKIQCGKFIVYSYGDEGFNFMDPHILAFLISYKKGLFVYTPVIFVAFGGLYFLFKRSKYQFWTFLMFFFAVIYVLSSWHQWYYGGSFSSRVMIEYYVFVSLILAVLLESVRSKKHRLPLISFFVILVIINQIQTYQYYAGHIHWDSMDTQKYWDVFLRLDLINQPQ